MREPPPVPTSPSSEHQRQGRFRSTAWSLIREVQGAPEHRRRAALGRLASLYWRPIYWTIRLEWGATPEDARDLTQEYFRTLLEGPILRRATPAAGRFRTYVKATVRNFMLRQRRAASALKRGGGRRILDLDEAAALDTAATGRSHDPTRAFERELMHAILERALESLRDDARRTDRSEHVELFLTWYGAAEQPTYRQLEERFGLNTHAVKNRLAEMRLRFRRIVLDLLRDGISSENELLSELREVFGA